MRKQLLLLALSFLFMVPVLAQSCHDEFPPPNQFSWTNDVRLAILRAGGATVNADKTVLNPGHPIVTKPLTCCLTLDQYGGIRSLSVLKTSGMSSVDNLAMRIIRKAAPFHPPPTFQGSLVVRFGLNSYVAVSQKNLEPKQDKPTNL